MSAFKAETAEGDVAAAKVTAHLPGLDIEIVHRQSADAEQIEVSLRVVPSFEAFSRALEAANPFAFWAHAAQLVWLPWLQAARVLTPRMQSARLPDSAGTTTVDERRSSD
ncbi:MAG TPA: hypothetical protein VGJ20_26095 [Xanthobacteraceae bacterium]